MNLRASSNRSIGVYNIINERNSQKLKTSGKCSRIFKIVLLLVCFAIIIYLFIRYDKFNSYIPGHIYTDIIESYDSIIYYAKLVDYLSNYHIFVIFFILGFCHWNIYKSYLHFIGFLICEYAIFLLKIIFRKSPQILNINFNKNLLSNDALNTLCDFTSEYECPSYRAAYVFFSYMSFITLLFKEKKLKNKKFLKFALRIIFLIISIIINASLIILLQTTIASIIIGSAIGFIIYYFMFSLLKIDYDRSEQMLTLINLNIIYYIIINALLFGLMFSLKFFLNDDKHGCIEKYKNLCNNTEYDFKKINDENLFKGLFFLCNLIAIICIKLQRKFIFITDGDFVSRNFEVEEISEQSNLLAQIRNEETNKFNSYLLLKYLCKVFICLIVTFFIYLIFSIIKYYRGRSYITLSVVTYLLPFNLLVIFLFLFSKNLFLHLYLENYYESE